MTSVKAIFVVLGLLGVSGCGMGHHDAMPHGDVDAMIEGRPAMMGYAG